MMMKVLAADVNQGYQDMSYWLVKEVNGRPILNMKELIAAMDDDTGGPFITLLSDDGQRIVLERESARVATKQILATYRIPADRSPDLQ
jgi:hypothetical protein